MQKSFCERHRDGVALLAEGVDRNTALPVADKAKKEVALLAEGVDRNYEKQYVMLDTLGRPPRGGRG